MFGVTLGRGDEVSVGGLGDRLCLDHIVIVFDCYFLVQSPNPGILSFPGFVGVLEDLHACILELGQGKISGDFSLFQLDRGVLGATVDLFDDGLRDEEVLELDLINL